MLLDLLSLYTRERFQDWDAWGGSWGEAWGNSWGPTNPNSMRASLAFGFSVDGTLVSPTAPGRSSVSRQWLIDYYTKAFEKPKEPPKPKRKVSRRKAEEVEEQRQLVVARKVQRAVAKAEADIAQLTWTIEDAQAAQQFVADLVKFAQESNKTILNFMSIGINYRQQTPIEDDLMLFALGFSIEVKPQRIRPEDGDLLLISQVM